MAKTLHTDSVQQRGADEEGAATTLLELHEVCHHSRRSFLVPPTLRLGGRGLHINKGYRGLLCNLPVRRQASLDTHHSSVEGEMVPLRERF